MRLIYIGMLVVLVSALLITPLSAGSDDDEDDETTSQEFALRVGHGVKIGDYRVELISVQSVRDGLIEVRFWKRISDVEDWRVIQEYRDANFDGGSERGGLTLTVIEIFDDESVSMRAEYREDYGFPRSYVTERGLAPKNVPELTVAKTFDKTDISVGDEVRVTVAVKNIGNDTAEDVTVFESPPMSEFRYLSGYPPKIKTKISPGESDFAVYTIVAVTEGKIEVPAAVVNYIDNEQNIYSESSDEFRINIRSKRKPQIDLLVDSVAPIEHGDAGSINVTIFNNGDASAYKIVAKGEISPSDDGLEIIEGSLDETFFEILPDKSETYSTKVRGTRSGDYVVTFRVNYEDDEDVVTQKDAAIQVVVLEREYKYLYYVPIIPLLIIIAWVFKRHKEYKY